VAEALTPIAFGFLPMALAAALAAILAFAGVSVPFEWIAFMVSGVAAYAALLPVGRRIARGQGGQAAVGAGRWVGKQAVVIEAIPVQGLGTVRLDREQWRAEADTDTVIPRGSTVLVTKVDGTRLVVLPLELAEPETEQS
jgi:membrane protein implicated in regulation of membrane protease activity